MPSHGSGIMQVTENPEGLRRKSEKRYALLANLGLLAGAVAGLIFLRGKLSILPLAALPWIAILLVFRSKGVETRPSQKRPESQLAIAFPASGILSAAGNDRRHSSGAMAPRARVDLNPCRGALYRG